MVVLELENDACSVVYTLQGKTTDASVLSYHPLAAHSESDFQAAVLIQDEPIFFCLVFLCQSVIVVEVFL